VITDAQVASYVRERGVLGRPPEARSEPSIERVPGRNLVYRVAASSGGCIVKQGFGPEGRLSIAAEAAAYRRLAERHDDRLDRYLPRYLGYDADRGALIVELVAGGQSLRNYHVGRRHFSQTLARSLGDALGTLHGLAGTHEVSNDLPDDPPWVFSIHRPDLNMLGHASSANLEMIRWLQRFPELGEHLDRLREEWAATVLLHFDLRWENCVVYGRPGSDRRTRLKLIDLELVQLGDPLWDIGCALSDYLSLWVLSIPMTGETQPDHFARLSRYPIERMQPAIRALWRSYAARRGLDPAVHPRVVDYCAARLIQTAFERNQLTPYLSGAVMCLLQLSLNIFEQRGEATTNLLGLVDGAR
jgi:Ser/Thr protein kinase RdoA (MazF antagonist)